MTKDSKNARPSCNLEKGKIDPEGKGISRVDSPAPAGIGASRPALCHKSAAAYALCKGWLPLTQRNVRQQRDSSTSVL